MEPAGNPSVGHVCQGTDSDQGEGQLVVFRDYRVCYEGTQGDSGSGEHVGDGPNAQEALIALG